ncbi:MAG: glycosyltransferase [Puniceicoccaceae bacterium]
MGGSLIWNRLQLLRYDHETQTSYRIKMFASSDRGLIYGWTKDEGTLSKAGCQIHLRGWIFKPRRRQPPSIRVRVGDRWIEPEWEERLDVVQSYIDDFVVPRRCGFCFRFNTGRGLKKVEVMVEPLDGSPARCIKSFLHFGWKRRRGRVGDPAYARWFAEFGDTNPSHLNALVNRLKQVDQPPLLSILLPVYNAPVDALELCVRSVVGQAYQHWELCMVDDDSTEEETREAVRRLSALDERIKVRYRSYNGHISEATNTAFDLVEGSYVGLLDHDDELTPNALGEVVLAIKQHPRARWFYSDEDKIDERGNLSGPYFKPDYDPLFLMRQNYICHFTVIERGLWETAGGMRVGLEGSQDWDLFLRLSRLVEPSQVVHIPKVLYHWRTVKGSSANSVGEKSYSVRAAARALRDHFKELELPVRSQSIKGMYWEPELILEVTPPTSWNLLEHSLGHHIERLAESAMDREWVLFFGAEINVSENQIQKMGAALRFPGVGLVAPLVLSEEGKILNGLTVLDPVRGVYLPHRGLTMKEDGMGMRAHLSQTCTSAIGPVVGVRAELLRLVEREILEEATSPAEQILLLGLILRESGWRSQYLPTVVLQDAQAFEDAIPTAISKRVMDRYGSWFEHDPAFNPNLSFETVGLKPASQPRSRVAMAGRD